AILLIPSIALLTAPAPTRTAAALSWNPAPASKFHAPLSSMGVVAVSGVNPHPDSPNAAIATGNSPTPEMTTIPQNTLRFITDKSYMPQSETTISIDPHNPIHLVR